MRIHRNALCLFHASHLAHGRQIIRIIFIVPLFAVTSWLSIGFPYAARYFELARSVYEAFAVLCFFYLLVQYLGGEMRLIRILIARRQREEVYAPSRANLTKTAL